MPYKLHGKCVVRADTGERVKCHPTRKKARAHLAALEINVSEKHKSDAPPDELWVDVEAMRRICPECADKMIAKGLSRVDILKAEPSRRMENLSRHLARRYGGDPHFFTKCTEGGWEELAGYDEDARKAICAVAHRAVTGIWTGSHRRGKSDDGTMMTHVFSICKVDERTDGLPDGILGVVEGWAGVQEPDRTHGGPEVMDVPASWPAIAAWSDGQRLASGGKSHGNVRPMHNPRQASGILLEPPRLQDYSPGVPGIYVKVGVVDDGDWRKCRSGTYTGLSWNGYGADIGTDKRWPGSRVYVMKSVVELTLCDRPCVGSALFTVVKADGTEEQIERREQAPVGDESMDVIEELQKLRNEHERAGDSQRAEMITNAITLVAQAMNGNEPEGPNEGAGETPPDGEHGQEMQKSLTSRGKGVPINKEIVRSVAKSLTVMTGDGANGPDIKGQLADLARAVADVASRVDAIAKQPIPGGPATTVVVNKSAGHEGATELQQLASIIRQRYTAETDPAHKEQLRRQYQTIKTIMEE